MRAIQALQGNSPIIQPRIRISLSCVLSFIHSFFLSFFLSFLLLLASCFLLLASCFLRTSPLPIGRGRPKACVTGLYSIQQALRRHQRAHLPFYNSHALGSVIPARRKFTSSGGPFRGLNASPLPGRSPAVAAGRGWNLGVLREARCPS